MRTFSKPLSAAPAPGELTSASSVARRLSRAQISFDALILRWSVSSLAEYFKRHGAVSAMEDSVVTHFEIKAPRYAIPQETRVMSTTKLLAGAASRNGKSGLFVDRRCRKLIEGWRVVEWNPLTGKIKKGSEDTNTHAPEAVDFYCYIEEPALPAQSAVGA